MRILTIEELLQVTGGGLTQEQKGILKSLKSDPSVSKEEIKAQKAQFKEANKSHKGSGKGSGPV